MTDSNKEARDAWLKQLGGIEYSATFVPQRFSRNAGEKTKSLNWTIRLARKGVAIVTDYMQGIGHVPGYMALSHMRRSVDVAYLVKQMEEASEEGTYPANTINVVDGRTMISGRWPRLEPLAPPSLDDVLHSLVMDSSAYRMPFEEWCSDYGYDTDSRKAYDTWARVLGITDCYSLACSAAMTSCKSWRACSVTTNLPASVVRYVPTHIGKGWTAYPSWWPPRVATHTPRRRKLRRGSMPCWRTTAEARLQACTARPTHGRCARSSVGPGTTTRKQSISTDAPAPHRPAGIPRSRRGRGNPRRTVGPQHNRRGTPQMETAKSRGQTDYEEDVRNRPKYHDGTPRPTWGKLCEIARWSWERPCVLDGDGRCPA